MRLGLGKGLEATPMLQISVPLIAFALVFDDGGTTTVVSFDDSGTDTAISDK